LFTLLEDRFKPEENKKLIYQHVQQKFVNDPYLSFLVDFSWNDEQYASFIKVFKLLSHEVHTNCDYNIIQKFDRAKVLNSIPYDKNFLERMIELQYVLFAFRTLLKMEDKHKIPTYNLHYTNVDLSEFSIIGVPSNKISDEDEDNMLEIQCCEFAKNGPIFTNMLRIMAEMYTFLRDKPDVQNMLLPILIHFRHVDQHVCNTHNYECHVVFQISFITITLVESYLIKNYSLPFYSLVIYSKLITCDKNGPNLSKLRHDIKTYAKRYAQSIAFMDSLAFVNLLFDENTYNTFFPEVDTQIQFFWNGRKLFGHEILKKTVQDVTDFNDLISFHWFGIKWFVGKILLVIVNALSFLFKKSKIDVSGEITIIKSKLNELLELELPKSINIFLADIINATIKLLNVNTPSFSSDIYQQWVDLFDFNFQALGLYQFEHITRFFTIEKLISVIDTDIENFKMFLNLPILRINNILISTDFSLSPIENSISNETYQILY